MADIDIRVTGRAGRITFTRAPALNAMTYDMCMGIDAALRGWALDDAVALVVIDALGDKAFCAGGDIAELYATGKAGNFAYGQKFWRDEYRLNALIAEYPKPVVSFMQGFVMGGGVGIGCHASNRVVDGSTRIAMPECGIGLVPDVGGSWILARAPGFLGEYLGLTGARMGPDDAIYAGFADTYIPRDSWPEVIRHLQKEGNCDVIAGFARAPEPGRLRHDQGEIDRLFQFGTLEDLLVALQNDSGDIAIEALKAVTRNAPLSMACAAKITQKLRDGGLGIRDALELEYRFTYRSMICGDFLEGIRAQIIDKDRNPAWKHTPSNVPEPAIAQMLAPLEEATLTF